MKRAALLSLVALAAACARDDFASPAHGEGSSGLETGSSGAPIDVDEGSTTSGGESSTGPSSDSESSGGPASSSSSGGEELAPWEWDLPENIPAPRVPEDNPMSAEKVELGRHLFYDQRLSANASQSCASCHDQARAFADGLALPTGSTGETVPMNSMALVNVAYNATYTWASPLELTLSDQAALPLFGDQPIELGAHLDEDAIFARLLDDPTYTSLFADAYPDETDPVSWINIRRAIASFERTLISVNSPYDQYTRGDEDAISESAKRGATLFFSEQFECFHCHGGFNFTHSTVHEDTAFTSRPFENNGLYNVAGTGQYPPAGRGLYRFTLDVEDDGKFRAPTLRNIALTAPYMHDGSVETLDEVLDIYAAGGRNVVEGPYAGDGRTHPNKSSFVEGFELTEEDRADFLAFLESLTDEEFITNPAFSDPWK
ncbi:MAG: MbnH family di-heme enzyme [Nannocystaceae bacterium]|nr:di-heme enzyme [bacterium]